MLMYLFYCLFVNCQLIPQLWLMNMTSKLSPAVAIKNPKVTMANISRKMGLM